MVTDRVAAFAERDAGDIRTGPGLTLDTGALVAIERGKRRVFVILDSALAAGLPIRVPGAAVAEFWQGSHSKDVRAFLAATFVPDTLERARRAGEALAGTAVAGQLRGPGVVDAMVAALASEHCDRVLTSDPADLTLLASWFGNLTVLAL